VRRSCEVVVYRPEQRERQITIHEQVPEQREVEYTVTIMERQNRSRTEYFTVNRPVQREVQQHYTVTVPYTEQRQATRLVSRLVPVQLTRTVCEDQGHWEERPCETQQQVVAYRGDIAAEGDACAPACGAQPCADACETAACAPATTRVWVPNIVRREIPYTQMQVKCEQQPYEFTVNLCRQEQRTRNVMVTEYVQERQSREVPFTVMVPRQVTRTRMVTEYRTVPRQISQPCTVMVAHREVREYDVPVTRMVAQVCEVPSPAACPTNACE
jgi:hypothetical protein